MEYDIVTGINAKSLVKKVNALIKEGWIPLGPHNYRPRGSNKWSQTMVKDED